MQRKQIVRVLLEVLAVWAVIIVLLGIQFISWSLFLTVATSMWGFEKSGWVEVIIYTFGMLGAGVGYLAILGGASVIRSLRGKNRSNGVEVEKE